MLSHMKSALLAILLMCPPVLLVNAAEEYQKTFPKVHGGQYPGILPFLASYAQEHRMVPLLENHLRFFVQPVGIIDSAFDVDLVSGAVTRYPGTHDKTGAKKQTLDAAKLKALNALVSGKTFQQVPERIEGKAGLDGCSYFIEVELAGKYLWRLRWEPDEPVFKRIEKLLKGESDGLIPKRGPADQKPAPGQ